MRKEFGLLVLLSVVLISGCGLEEQGNSSNQGKNITASTQVQSESAEEITWSSENGEVTLDPIKVIGSHEYQGVNVKIDGKKKEFSWSFIEEPRVFYADVTTDGKKEAIIILNKGTGTGVSLEELHVLNSKDLSEIKVQNYEEITADEIETSVTKKSGDTLAIKIKVQGKEYEMSYDDPDPGFNQDKLNFGGSIYFELKGNKNVLRLGASVGPSPHYVGDFYITYKFDSEKNELTADLIEFVPDSGLTIVQDG